MKLSILFWNLQKRPLKTRITRLLAARRPDVAIFAEYDMSDADLLTQVNAVPLEPYVRPASLAKKLRLFTTLDSSFIQERYNSVLGHCTIWTLRLPHAPPILLCGVHLASKLGWTGYDQAFEAQKIAKELSDREEIDGHQRTLVIGDFNMNPYDAGLVASHAFHASMCASTAATRTVAGTAYSKFYNPMWGLLGDRTSGPPGTLYHPASTPTNTFWHMLDQILVRPELENALCSVQILDSDGTDSLLKNGRPDASTASDHLPIYCELDCSRIS
ncbi:endonuclease/exonuclease/phosphatase family protein [Lignipirellula cremea]|uniref:Endonuclease/Exonuclease/phosphatase family protein n=1 Tax=Lignipirellula cremea TaxID=2528010 RepID=A0A518DLL3_9BACT|nr:endonuclease/exonuclease/phosphatase family protein [Lignipirellula cremea]QDU92729.1 Endonuclease/Exonuclease/phosphatase family protein [Lignipirellula cremea]